MRLSHFKSFLALAKGQASEEVRPVLWLDESLRATAFHAEVALKNRDKVVQTLHELNSKAQQGLVDGLVDGG